MCVPEISIREDGKGFVVRKGGIDFDVDFASFWWAWSPKPGVEEGCGDTIMEAVDSALAKVRAAEITEAAIQEGKREA
jgi:hypothetical protein